MKLRQYQIELVDRARLALSRHKSVCLQLPTGGGKTVLAGEITRRLMVKHAGNGSHGVAGLFLLHRKELIDQTLKTLRDFGLGNHTGVIQSGFAMTPWADLQVASIQTLAKRMDELHWLDPKIVFIDEAHHCRAATWEKVIGHYKQRGKFLLGLTATPARLDGKGLGNIFGYLIEGPSILDLTEMGFLAECKTFWLPAGFDQTKIRTTAGDYNKKDLDERMTGPVIASVVKNWLKHGQNAKTLHFAITRRHSREVAQKAQEQGIAAAHVDGDMPAWERNEILRKFRDGALTFLSNVELFTEGLDCPDCRCVVVSRKTKSITLWKQMIGRGMRPNPGGEPSIIIDCAGNEANGDPDADIEWSLLDGITDEEKRKVRKGKRTCDHCKVSYPVHRSQCPECGNTYLTKTAEEVDVEVQERKAKKKPKYGGMTRKQLSRKILSCFAKPDPLEEMRQLAIRVGYNPNVAHIWMKKWAFADRNQNRSVDMRL